mmetsp:Transcript_17228/g.61210  ORF Transcript_17228/g.61210 Transcript_17228/m.61210 type:complete len:223 (-) Transcript_17228:1346-2014(-)
MRTLSAAVAAWPCSSNAITTTAAPCFRSLVACSMKSASPTLSEMLLQIGLPWHHFRPASTISNLDESIMNGTLATSGSVTAILTNFCIAEMPSIMPSSTLMSKMCAPFSIWALAMSMASANLPCWIRRLNFFEPEMLQRSPTLMKGSPHLLYAPSATKSSRPESHMRGGPFIGSPRGGRSLTASWIAATCGGVEPQQPPIMFTQPLSAKTTFSRAMSAGVSS